MGKAEKCIKMLQYLNTGGIRKISDIASYIESNPKNIPEYRKELEECGYFIIDRPGRNGGYQLNTEACIPALKLLADEKEALVYSHNYLLNKEDYMKKDAMERAYSKIFSNIEIEDKNEKMLVVDKYQLSMDNSDIETRYLFIEKAIKQKRKIEIEYMSLKHGTSTKVLSPYKLFIYNNSWFFLAFDPEHNEIRYYKLNRMNNGKILKDKFVIPSDFKPEEYFDEHGLKQNGNYYHVELIARGTRARLMKERIYGKNQVVTDNPDGSVNVSLDMQDDETMVAFTLGCGNNITILEPEWLKERTIQAAQEVIMLYNRNKK